MSSYAKQFGRASAACAHRLCGKGMAAASIWGATAGHRAGDKHKKEVFFPAVLPLLHHGHLKICKCVKRLTLNIIIQGDQKIMKRLLKG